jgi:hypothetical protein
LGCRASQAQPEVPPRRWTRRGWHRTQRRSAARASSRVGSSSSNRLHNSVQPNACRECSIHHTPGDPMLLARPKAYRLHDRLHLLADHRSIRFLQRRHKNQH